MKSRERPGPMISARPRGRLGVVPPNDPRQVSTHREPSAPPAPSRVRMVRPQFYRAEVTGSLAPDVRDLLIALMTVADDEGWLLWRAAELAATIYTYSPAGRRLRDLERRSGELMDLGLVIVEPCGCAFLPSLKEHHAVKSGRQTAPIWAWHMRHRGIPGNAEECSSSSSSSSSGSDKASGSSSSRAREDGVPADARGVAGAETPEEAKAEADLYALRDLPKNDGRRRQAERTLAAARKRA